MSLNDDTQMDTEPVRGADAPTSAPSAGDADAGAARSHVHSVRPIGSIVGERFIVKAHLGRGRLDERYSAVDRSLSDPDVASERSVVLHFLNGRVAQQTRLLQKLETSYHHPHSWAHRNLIGILGFGSDRGEYYFVTEELEGGTLRTILDEVAPEVPPEEEAFSVLAGIGDALKYAHAKGVVHGDIRPENVFVTRGDLVVKVLDLLPATLPRTVPMFPEDNGDKGPVPDPRDDVYGLACVAYELFSGKHPFNSNTALEALAAGLRPAPILSLDPRSWSALVGGLALRREQRTPSVSAFLADLGVTGRERLRRASEADRASTASNTAAAPAARDDDADWGDLSDRTLETMSVRRPTARAASASAPQMSAPQLSAPSIDHEYELFRARRFEPRPSASRWLPWVLAIGAAAAVYWNYGWLHAHGSEWYAMGVEAFGKAVQGNQATVPRVASEPAAPADGAAPSASPQLANTAPPGSGPQQASGGAPNSGATNSGATNSGATNSVASSIAPAPKDVRPPPKDSSPAPQESATPAKEAGPVPKAASAQPPTAADANPSQATQVQRAAVAGEPVAAEIFEPEKPVVVVSEAAPGAAITIRRHGSLDAAASVVWWTTDGTAIADEDYINLGARIEKFAPGEQTRTIIVPIVHDSKPEPRESFYVNIRPGQGGKREDPAARVEVVIEDDD